MLISFCCPSTRFYPLFSKMEGGKRQRRGFESGGRRGAFGKFGQTGSHFGGCTRACAPSPPSPPVSHQRRGDWQSNGSLIESNSIQSQQTTRGIIFSGLTIIYSTSIHSPWGETTFHWGDAQEEEIKQYQITEEQDNKKVFIIISFPVPEVNVVCVCIYLIYTTKPLPYRHSLIYRENYH